MTLKDNLEAIIREKNSRKNDNIDRDINIILTYFGMGDQDYPTYETVAEKFGVGTRERVRQIINKKFIKKVKIYEIEMLQEISRIIASEKAHYCESMLEKLHELQLTDQSVSMKGLFNLLHIFNFNKEYNIYDTSIDIATKKEIENNSILIVFDEKKAEVIRKLMKVVHTSPGKYGLSNLYDVFEHNDFDLSDFELVKTLIINSVNSWAIDKDEKNFWYMIENRDNALINCMGKMINATETIDIEILAHIIYGYLTKRSLPMKFPTVDTIKSYLQNSRYVEIKGNKAKLVLVNENLTEIEKKILNLYEYKNTDTLAYGEIYEALDDGEISRVYINQSIYSSPYIYVDRSKGKGRYEFILVSKFSSAKTDIDERSEYYDYKKRLTNLYGNTDVSAYTTQRNEQRILSEWLFGNKKTEKCAICGKEFSVKALVTAHKKKRSLCSEGERIDPYIVMPLCLFGCDYLYENRYAIIESGTVKINTTVELGDSELEYLNDINNNRINARWAKGSETYFR